jgi:hypothetical protein
MKKLIRRSRCVHISMYLVKISGDVKRDLNTRQNQLKLSKALSVCIKMDPWMFS